MPLLESLGNAVPGEPVPQAAVKAKAEQVVSGLAPDLLQYLKVFDTTGIQNRHFIRPLDWYLEPHGWEQRSQLYREEGLSLLEACAKRALQDAHVEPQDKALPGRILILPNGLFR